MMNQPGRNKLEAGGDFSQRWNRIAVATQCPVPAQPVSFGKNQNVRGNVKSFKPMAGGTGKLLK
jgi:hypothetical protein